MKKFDTALIIGLIFTMILTGLSRFSSDYNDLKSNVIRLHILANSDMAYDQQLKLDVRDRILEDTKDVFLSELSYTEMENCISENLSLIEEIACDEIEKRGYNYPVKAEYVNMPFNERKYGDITLPGGYYNALRITIGEAKGHNWWCMMYPSMCISASVDWDEYNEVFTPQEIDMMKNPQNYRFKFKIVELFEKLKKMLDKKLK